MINQTAILIFANSASKEVEQKSFLSKEIVCALNEQTLNIVEKTGLPYFHFSEKEQKGNNFGERFTNAIASIFKKGYSKVITIGNDTPHLQSHHIKSTSEKLANNHLVLGPSKDGGFYLMGITKAHFCKKTFLKLPWQTEKLSSAINKIIAVKQLVVHFLEHLQDIDVKEDIKKIIHSFRLVPVKILSLLQQVITVQKQFFTTVFLKTLQHFSNPNFNKGSPLVFVK